METDYRILQRAVLAHLINEDVHPDIAPESLQFIAVAAGIVYDYQTQTWEIEE